ncbi:MAG: hypothetical protein AAFV95_18730 [Bacteroidota bacterium]
MRMDIERIFLTGLAEQDDETEIADGSTDVIVSFRNGDRYAASFLSYDAVARLRQEHLQSGDFLKGKYLWINNLLLIESCNRQTIDEVVDFLLDEGDFPMVFRKL